MVPRPTIFEESLTRINLPILVFEYSTLTMESETHVIAVQTLLMKSVETTATPYRLGLGAFEPCTNQVELSYK